MDNKEKQHNGQLYLPSDPAIMEEQMVLLDNLRRYNEIPHVRAQEREQMLRRMFAEVGEGTYIESPLYANFGGKHVHLGKFVYSNFNLTLVDDTHIYIGDYTMIGPNVTIATAGHPVLPELRRQGMQYNIPVRIGSNCWLGAGVMVMPGVTIGDNTVIGAGSVVTRDIPANVVAAGTPCRVMRPIGEHDRVFYFRDRKIPDSLK